MKQAAFIVIGLFFALIALMLFTGLYLNYPILGLDTPAYFWPNLLGFIITTLISVWMFLAAKRL